MLIFNSMEFPEARQGNSALLKHENGNRETLSNIVRL